MNLWFQGVSIGTIKTKENVCCVQFPSDSGRSLAFGSADHRVYYYDLRNPKLPLCTMIGHTKTVSYVRFVDSSTLVSSSTDNTLKLWDLSMSVSGVNEAPVHSFMGHTNLKVQILLELCFISTPALLDNKHISVLALCFRTLSDYRSLMAI